MDVRKSFMVQHRVVKTGKINLVVILAFLSMSFNLLAQGPVIDVWYGDTQKFGHLGTPQPWVNILGNVSDPDGIKKLSYTLNDGDEVILSVGPDGRRLQNNGDFNIDIHFSSLSNGNHDIAIYAIDSLDNESSTNVSFDFLGGQSWTETYSFQWDTVTHIQNVMQIVDGKWELTPDGVRTVETGYDRLLAIGDTSWVNYQIEVPITVHEIEAPISEFGGNDFGLGLLVRWTGHTDTPVSGWQPKSGYLPIGEIGWFNWPRLNTSNTQLNFFHSTNTTRTSFEVEDGKTYNFKLQVATKVLGHTYNLKVWEQGTSEPEDWTIENVRNLPELAKGSFMFVAHHVDATFGNPSVMPIYVPVPHFSHEIDEEDFLKFDFNASSSSIPEGSIAEYEWDFGDGNSATGINTSHTYASEGLYEVKLKTTSSLGVFDEYVVQINVKDYSIPSTIESDDFSNGEPLNTDLWEFVTPTADGSYSHSTIEDDKVVNLHIPSGSTHEVWNGIYNPVALLQSTNDTNFEIEARFLSDVNQSFQQQGFLIQEDEDRLIRADFYSDGSQRYIFVATFEGGTPTIQTNTQLTTPFNNGMFLKVKRQVSDWTISYSTDGVNWTVASEFNFTLQVSNAGVFGGNSGANPAHTAIVDYFFNSEEKIVPEDGVVNPPIADFDFTVDTENDLILHFDASSSISFNGAITGYEWAFGDGSSPGSGVSISHTFPAPGTYTVGLTVTDESELSSSFTQEIHVGDFLPPSDIVSDDFSSSVLNTDVWEFINPAGDGSYEFINTGASAVIALNVPQGSTHEIWQNVFTPVGLVQSCNDSDFEIEAKFESNVTQRFQGQGILVAEDAERLLRIETFSDGSQKFLFIAQFEGGIPEVKLNKTIEFENSIYIKVGREGDHWDISSSNTGVEWESGVEFEFPMTVAKVGVYGSNAGNNPAHTALVDYFFNNASRIHPEDNITSADPTADTGDNFTLFPNPAKSSIHLSYSLQLPSTITLEIYDFQGKLMKDLLHEKQGQGSYTLSWDVNELPAGMYLIKIITANNFRSKSYTEKLIILK